jgi:hypothetical protein
MNPILPNKDYPILLFKNFKIPEDSIKTELVKKISEKKRFMGPSYTEALSFPIKIDYKNFLFDLYDDFVEISKKHLKKFTISDKNTKRYWAYATNRFDPHYQWHDHIRTSTINGVYYFRIPESVSGQLDFWYKDNFFRFFPEENDLLLMPNYLKHAPRQPLSDEYRISINVEIICNEDPDDIFIDYIGS